MFIPDELVIAIAVEGSVFQLIDVIPRLRTQLITELFEADQDGTLDYIIRNKCIDLIIHLHDRYMYDIRSWMLTLSIEVGSLELVEWMIDKGASLVPDPIAHAMINNHQAVAKYFIQRGYMATGETISVVAGHGNLTAVKELCSWGIVPTEDSLGKAAFRGHLGVIQFLHEELKVPITSSVILMAVLGNQYESVKYLLERWNGTINDNIMLQSARNINIIKLLEEHGGEINDDVLKYSCEIGNYDVINEICHRLIADGRYDCSDSLYRKIVRSGNHEAIIKFYNEHRGNMIDAAVLSGDIKVVEFMIQRGHRPTSETVNKAIDRGDLSMVKYLHETHKVPFGEFSDCSAVLCGKLEMIKYVIERATGLPSGELLDIAIYNGGSETIKYLIGRGANPIDANLSSIVHNKDLGLIKFITGIGYNRDKIPEAIAEAAGDNSFDIVDYLHQLYGGPSESTAVEQAACNGHMKMVEHLYSLGYRIMDIGNVASVGELGILKFLVGKGERPDENTMTAAARNGHFEVVKYLNSIGVPLNDESLSTAMIGGYLSIVAYHDQHGIEIKPVELGRSICGGNLSILRYCSKYITKELIAREFQLIMDYMNENGHTRELDERSHLLTYDDIMYLISSGNVDELRNLYVYQLTLNIIVCERYENLIMVDYLKSLLVR